MWKGAFAAAMLAATVTAAPPAKAGERHRVDVVHHHHVHAAPWYRQPPWIGTGVGHYYSYPPRHVPGYPHRLTGYPVPIHKLADSDPIVRTFRGAPSAHVEWCLVRYRSYDAHSDTWQPYHGPRRFCLSPYR